MRDKKVLLVLGASSDFGMKLISDVANQYEVILAQYFHDSEKLKKLKDNLKEKLFLFQSDFSDEDSVKHMINEIINLGYMPDHIAHFSAPKAFNEKFLKCNWSYFIKEIEISLRSLVEVLHAFLPSMVKNKYGKIVLMLSSYTIDIPPKYQSPYVTTKYALLGLMKSLSVEYIEKGITVNAVSPAMTETKFLSEIPELIVKQNAYLNPCKENLCVEDVIPSFVYLLSDGADAVTGQNIGVTYGGK